MPFTPMWMNLEDIMLSRVSHAEKDKFCIIPLTCGIYKTL